MLNPLEADIKSMFSIEDPINNIPLLEITEKIGMGIKDPRKVDWKSTTTSENILATKIQTCSKDGIRKLVNWILSRIDLEKSSTTVMKWEKLALVSQWNLYVSLLDAFLN